MHSFNKTIVDAIEREIAYFRSINKFTLGVAGLGGTGKTSACRAISNAPDSKVVIFEIDWFLRLTTVARRQQISAALTSGNTGEVSRWEDPSSWYDWEALISALKLLKTKGELSLLDAWDQKTGNKDLSVQIRDAQGSTILVDGIYLLHPYIRHEMDRVLLVETDLEASQNRSQQRDSHRSDSAYLDWKSKLMLEFDIPYFKRYRDKVDSAIVV